MSIIMLCDNGSLKPNATLQLRQLAAKLAQSSGQAIHPVSFQHADRIAAERLDGEQAQIFYSFMAHQLALGQRDFKLLPLFFGRSRALTSFVPEQLNSLKGQFGEFNFDITEVIYPLPTGEPLLSDIIYEHIIMTANQHQLPLDNIVLVDHGSPIPRVTEVRKHLAQTVQAKLPADCLLEQAVMERREGREYDFNGDLLRDWLLQKAGAGANSAIVILMFFLAGRHAGKGGDIVEICNSVMQQYPDVKIVISPLITEHPKFVQILHKRLQNII